MTTNRHSKTSYIYSETNPYQWIENPEDPFIYISFSYKQFKKTYMNLPNWKNAGQSKEYFDLHPSVIEKFEKMIEKEFVQKAGLPVKYLSTDEDIGEIFNKNVYFLVVDPELTFEKAYTLASQHAILSSVKISAFRDIKPDDLTSKDKYILLHEGMHGLIGAKHFRPYDFEDADPFITDDADIDLNCLNTVIAYDEDCPPVLNDPLPLYTFDGEGNLIGNSTIPNIYNYPTQLGEIDLEAARIFNNKWKERNLLPDLPTSTKSAASSYVSPLKQLFSWVQGKFTETPSSQVKSTQITISSTQSIFLTLKMKINNVIDSVEEKSKSYSRSVVTECECYFPPRTSVAYLNYWTTSPLEKNATLCNIQTTSPSLAIGFTPMLKLP